MKTILVKRILPLFFLFTACSDEVIYQKEYVFPDHVWKIGMNPLFEFEIKNSQKQHKAILTFRTTTDFKYKKIYFFTTIITPQKEQIRTLNTFAIIDENDSWNGIKTGSLVEFKKEVDINFNQKGFYKLQVEPAVTASIIDEIIDIGLTVSPI
jgi:gliding motility-associated lipoprotein GldH